MIFPVGLVVAAALAASPTAQHPVQSFYYSQLKPGQEFQIVTSDQVFAGSLIDPATGECLATTGAPGEEASATRRMWLLGSTHGPEAGSGGLSMVLMHQVRVGMRMEIADGELASQSRTLTAPVRSITLLSNAPPAGQTAIR